MYTQEDAANLPNLKNKLSDMEEKRAELEHECDLLHKKIYELERITDFYNGVPLDVTGNKEMIVGIYTVPTNSRGSKIYKNKSDLTYMVFIYDHGDLIQKNIFLSYEEALIVAKEWVVNGVLPQ